MRLEKIQNESPKIPELVMRSLIAAIESGQIRVGEDLPSERDLAESLGVGRGSLRECLAVLEFLDAIESKGNRKRVAKDAAYIQRAIAFIRTSNGPDTQKEFMEFRLINEVAAAEFACQRATQEDLDAIRAAVKMLEERPWDASADVAFHDALANASHNTVLIATLHLFSTMISGFRSSFYSLPDYVQRSQESHQAIYDAVQARDVSRARYEMERHLRIAREFIDKYAELMEKE